MAHLQIRPVGGMVGAGLKSPVSGQPPAPLCDAAIFAPGFRPVRSPMAGVRRYKAGNGTNNPARLIRVLSPRRSGSVSKAFLAALATPDERALSMTATTDTTLSISDLAANDGDEPRILDLRIAERLGMADPHDIRRTIEANRAELETYGVISGRRPETSRKAGRPSTAYYLNEAQTLLVCMYSRTPKAAEVRKEVIGVYMAYRAGTLTPAQDRALVKVREHLRRVSTSHRTVTRLETLVKRLEEFFPSDAPPLIPMSSQPRKIAGYLVDVEDHDIRAGDDVMLLSEAGGYFVTTITLGGTIPCVAAGVVMVAVNPPSGVRYAPCKLIGKVVRRRVA